MKNILSGKDQYEIKKLRNTIKYMMLINDCDEILYIFYNKGTLGYKLKIEFTFVKHTMELLKQGLTKKEIIELYEKRYEE